MKPYGGWMNVKAIIMYASNNNNNNNLPISMVVIVPFRSTHTHTLTHLSKLRLLFSNNLYDFPCVLSSRAVQTRMDESVLKISSAMWLYLDFSPKMT